MLLPSLNGARKMAKSSSCMSNMRQLGLLSISYAADSNGYFPSRPTWQGFYGLIMLAGAETDGASFAPRFFKNGVKGGYLCPAQKSIPGVSWYATNYSYTGASTGVYDASPGAGGIFWTFNGCSDKRYEKLSPNSGMICEQGGDSILPNPGAASSTSSGLLGWDYSAGYLGCMIPYGTGGGPTVTVINTYLSSYFNHERSTNVILIDCRAVKAQYGQTSFYNATGPATALQNWQYLR